MNVVFLPAAEHDLGSLVTYIQDDLQNPAAAHNIAAKILRRAQMLASLPEMGANLGNVDTKLAGYRYLIADNYVIIYRLTGSEVCIVRIRYARSDYVQLLEG